MPKENTVRLSDRYRGNTTAFVATGNLHGVSITVTQPKREQIFAMFRYSSKSARRDLHAFADWIKANVPEVK